ncbi:MAG: tetratricopeptide repeat protein [Pseudomonadota bacterium]
MLRKPSGTLPAPPPCSRSAKLPWNTFDSLAEAQALAGRREEAITNYRRSVELNPHNDNGRQMLEKLGAPLH